MASLILCRRILLDWQIKKVELWFSFPSNWNVYLFFAAEFFVCEVSASFQSFVFLFSVCLQRNLRGEAESRRRLSFQSRSQERVEYGRSRPAGEFLWWRCRRGGDNAPVVCRETQTCRDSKARINNLRKN